MVITEVISTNIVTDEMIFKRTESRQFKLHPYPFQSIKYYFSLRDVYIGYKQIQYFRLARNNAFWLILFCLQLKQSHFLEIKFSPNLLTG